MKPGPPPKPPQLKLLQGNPGKRPIPKQLVAPTAGADCPRVLSAAAKREWKRLQPELERLGLLTQIDRASLAAYCEAWADFEWAVRKIKSGSRVTEAGNGTLIPHPAVLIKKNAMQKIREFAAEFGFTPAARGRVHLTGPPAEDDDDASFFKPRGPQAVPPPRAKRT
jgi:P27 family predicted phage terminase small subunit